MSQGIFIVGTDTDVGKTIVSAGIISFLRQHGYQAGYFKPVLSGAILENGYLIPGDTRFVKVVADLEDDETSLTGYSFLEPVSPHLAARLAGVEIEVEIIREKLQALQQKYPYLVVEGAGGLMVPLTSQGYLLLDLIRDLQLNLLVVARAGLGTINHTLLTVKQAERSGLRVSGIIINGYTGAASENESIRMIAELTQVPLWGVIPYLEGVSVSQFELGNLKEVFWEQLQIEQILLGMNEF